MKLAQFIDQAQRQIVDESEKYAAKLPALSGQAVSTLRDHLPLVLAAISRDLKHGQSRAESIAKSEGRGPESFTETAAQTHGLLRARSGLTIEQLVAEYRVLRSSVLRLWGEAHEPDRDVISDTLRFNEAIDQAVAESVTYFSAEVERWRGIFLGIVGHDLRGPLNAMIMTAEAVARADPKGTGANGARAILRNGRHMATLLDSLLDYSRSEIGKGMKIHRTPVDLAPICAEEMATVRATLPDAKLTFDADGDTRGDFDGARVREALANLVFNASQHGNAGTVIAATLRGQDDAVELSVTNDCGPIASDVLENLFEPLRHHSTSEQASDRNLGLGLFIVREIARAHDGDVTVSIADQRITFKIIMPKRTSVATLPQTSVGPFCKASITSARTRSP